MKERIKEKKNERKKMGENPVETWGRKG